MAEKDEFGISLSLNSSDAHRWQLHLNLMPPASSFPPQPLQVQSEPQWTADLQSPLAKKPLLPRRIDVNRAPAECEAEDDVGAWSSPNSTVSSGSATGGKRGGEEHDAVRASDEEDGEGSRKKLRLSKEQSTVLEESFKEHNTLNPKQKLALAKQLNLRPRQVEVWFQNRRARTKLKQTEVDCEFLKRCCENLIEENRRLQKEVQELRALKLSPQFYMHMPPPTTLTMCPSCERVAVSNPAASPPSTAAPHMHRTLFLRPPAAAAPATWASVPLRPSFLDAPPQRS